MRTRTPEPKSLPLNCSWLMAQFLIAVGGNFAALPWVVGSGYPLAPPCFGPPFFCRLRWGRWYGAPRRVRCISKARRPFRQSQSFQGVWPRGINLACLARLVPREGPSASATITQHLDIAARFQDCRYQAAPLQGQNICPKET